MAGAGEGTPSTSLPIADVSTAEDHLYSFGDEDVERERLLL